MSRTESPAATPATGVVVLLPDGRSLRFFAPFHIGRDHGCEVQIEDGLVSRRHAEVARRGGQWIVRDLQSANGLFVDGSRVDVAPIGQGVTVSLSADGPTLQIGPEAQPEAAPGARAEPTTEDSVVLDAYAERYFGGESDEQVGGRTLMIRKAFQKVHGRQRRRHRWTLSAVVLAALCVAAYALYERRLIKQQEEQAQRIFYGMKALEVQFAELQQELALAGIAPDREKVARYMAQHRQMEADYESYAANLYDRKLNEKDRLILRITRLFGECDVAAPSEYVGEVARYIEKWRSTGRFVAAVRRAQERGYTPKIVTAFSNQGLPPQYFYLAMQESDFIPDRVGPPTRWGFAKGMWQFIPETGKRFGLRIGPLASGPQRLDPDDERFDWEKATDAAARYVKEIYSTEAKASGLLVMASYNWGEHRIIDRLRNMPTDPRERNFWKLLEMHRVPPETYDYVFSIVSAAAIGENPRLFGFPIDNPLKLFEQG